MADLGVTTLWIGPVFRQRVEDNSYHGYGIQNFLDIDPNAPVEMKAGQWLEGATHDESHFVELFCDSWVLGPSEVIVLANRAAFDDADPA